MPSTLSRHALQPPCSSWAEETILSDVLRDPSLMDRIGDIGPELQFPEFRLIWRAMCQARGGQSFYSAVHDALEFEVCHDQHNPDTDSGRAYYAVCAAERAEGTDIDNPISHWWWCDAKCLLRLLNGGTTDPCIFDLALAVLHNCTQARQMVTDAAELADRAWRLNVAGARQTATRISRYGRATRTSPPPPIWERVDAF